jgi:hypothetical protein
MFIPKLKKYLNNLNNKMIILAIYLLLFNLILQVLLKLENGIFIKIKFNKMILVFRHYLKV